MESLNTSSCSLTLPTLQDYLGKLREYYESSPSKDSRWFTKVIVDCNKFLPVNLRHASMESVTPEMLQEAINRVCRLGGKRYQSIVTGIRDCFRLATLDGTITNNPALHVHIREINSTSNPIDDALYQEILRQVRIVPGGYLFGLAGFADTSMESMRLTKIEDCDPNEHTILFHRSGRQKLARIADPDGIALLDSALSHYEERMKGDTDYAHNNSGHLLCTTRFGMPYERKQLATICEILRDACNNPCVDVTTFRRYVRFRQL